MMLRLAPALTVLLASAAAAQRPPALVRLEAGTCAACSVSLELIATLGKSMDAELLDEYGQLTRLSDGGFLVSSIRPKVSMLRYDRVGTYVGTLGKIGDGPGEFRQPRSQDADGVTTIKVYRIMVTGRKT